MWFVCVDRGVTYVVCAECGVVYLECSVYQMWVVLHWKLVVWIEYDLFVLIAVLLVLFAMTVMLINLNAMLFVMRVVLWYMSRWVCDKCHVECVVNVCFVSWLRAVKFTHTNTYTHTQTHAHTHRFVQCWKYGSDAVNPWTPPISVLLWKCTTVFLRKNLSTCSTAMPFWRQAHNLRIFACIPCMCVPFSLLSLSLSVLPPPPLPLPLCQHRPHKPDLSRMHMSTGSLYGSWGHPAFTAEIFYVFQYIYSCMHMEIYMYIYVYLYIHICK